MKAISLRRTPLDLGQPCWPWPGSILRHGYARIMVDGAYKYVHRLSYQLHVGPIPKGMQIDHACHTRDRDSCAGGDSCLHRRCWNPAHLELVTLAENSRRGNHPLHAAHRKSACLRGHDLNDPANVYTYADGKRRCRRCAVELQKAKRHAGN